MLSRDVDLHIPPWGDALLPEEVGVAFTAVLTAVVMASTALEVNVEAIVNVAHLGILVTNDQDE